MKRGICLLLTAVLCLAGGCAQAQEYDAQVMTAWLARFCDALAQLPVLGDPQRTADPARPGEYLLEYGFGAVTSRAAQDVQGGDILEIDVRTQQVTDCRGMRVGMTLGEVTGGQRIGRSSTQLYVLGTQEAGLGFSWAYLGDGGVYGVEYITYGGEGAQMTEYTLTYVLDEAQTVSAIRVRCAQTTQAQAEQAMRTAEEIASRQLGEVYAVQNSAAMLEADDLTVMGVRALGTQVADLVAALGEPVEVQELERGRGRLLLYEGAAVELCLNEQTGEEVACGVSASSPDVAGPRGLCVGMSVQEAAALFRCDEDVYAVGGTMYMEGEAAGEPPCGELIREGGETVLRYAAALPSGHTAVLSAGVTDGMIAYWHFFDNQEAGHDGI